VSELKKRNQGVERNQFFFKNPIDQFEISHATHFEYFQLKRAEN